MRRFVVSTLVGVAGVVLYVTTLFPARPPVTELERTVELTYRFTVRDVPPGAQPVVAWVPVPPSNELQGLEALRVEGDWPQTILDEPEYGNRFLRLDLSSAIQNDTVDVIVAVTFQVSRREYRSARQAPDHVTDADLARYLAADSLVPIDGKIAEEAKRVVGTQREPLAQARKLYDHIVQSMVYDKTGGRWGRGDAVYACDIRSGNCTDFHSLFIGEARALGIPARFVMGLPLPEGVTAGEITGYHCWAEFYLADRGWIPLDASEAYKHPEKKEALFAGLDQHRLQFTLGRDITIPQASAGPFNYVIYPYVEVGGKPHTRVETSFSFRDKEAGDQRMKKQ